MWDAPFRCLAGVRKGRKEISVRKATGFRYGKRKALRKFWQNRFRSGTAARFVRLPWPISPMKEKHWIPAAVIGGGWNALWIMRMEKKMPLKKPGLKPDCFPWMTGKAALSEKQRIVSTICTGRLLHAKER